MISLYLRCDSNRYTIDYVLTMSELNRIKRKDTENEMDIDEENNELNQESDEIKHKKSKINVFK